MRARKIHGVTVTPRWEWSKDYRRLVLEVLRKPSRSRADYEATAEAYCRWIAERDSIDLAEANRAEVVWDWDRASARERFIRAVRFYDVEPGSGEHYRSGRRWYQRPAERALVAEISIPNHDWQPTVTTYRQPARNEVASALESLFA